MKLLLGFPGQGSQKLMMGKELAVRFPASCGRVFASAGEPVMWGDSAAKLSETHEAQRAVLLTSIATLAALKERHGFEIAPRNTAALVGHSLGEFSCLVAAGCLSLAEAEALVTKRGLAMQSATAKWGKKPSMVAVLGLKWDDALEIQRSCPPDLLCEAANENGPEQTVLSGCELGVAWGVNRAKELYGGKRGIKLAVSCPFHSSVMKLAAQEFHDAIYGANILPPKVPIVFGLDGRSRSDPTEIRFALKRGMYSPVRWRIAIENSVKAYGPCEFREVGGNTLRFGLDDIPGLQSGAPITATVQGIEDFSDRQ